MDGQSDESVVLNDHYTTDLNTYKSGTVRYPFEDLEAGMHTLELVVWDVQNNGSAEVEFIVAPSLDAAIGAVTAYPNPSATGSTLRLNTTPPAPMRRTCWKCFRPQDRWYIDEKRSGLPMDSGTNRSAGTWAMTLQEQRFPPGCTSSV